MRILHIEARSKADLIPVVRKALRHLKGKLSVLTTVQHISKIEEVIEFLSENAIKADFSGQVLGCTVPDVSSSSEQVLYIGSGRFHPIGIYLRTGKEVITANPFSGQVSKITKKDVEAIEKRKRGAAAKFLSSKNIGILVSTKPGQTGIQGGEKSIKQMEKKYKDKQFYMFAFETLDSSYLEDFTFIECWVNTACPRIFEDFRKGMINLEDIP
ncbi:hypothetical protein GF345_02735 [Candidatus Woesearchaeota archaeon]|nr:hypothetical protein [Candidatus Woesearchaeota archaeon]